MSTSPPLSRQDSKSDLDVFSSEAARFANLITFINSGRVGRSVFAHWTDHVEAFSDSESSDDIHSASDSDGSLRISREIQSMAPPAERDPPPAKNASAIATDFFFYILKDPDCRLTNELLIFLNNRVSTSDQRASRKIYNPLYQAREKVVSMYYNIIILLMEENIVGILSQLAQGNNKKTFLEKEKSFFKSIEVAMDSNNANVSKEQFTGNADKKEKKNTPATDVAVHLLDYISWDNREIGSQSKGWHSGINITARSKTLIAECFSLSETGRKQLPIIVDIVSTMKNDIYSNKFIDNKNTAILKLIRHRQQMDEHILNNKSMTQLKSTLNFDLESRRELIKNDWAGLLKAERLYTSLNTNKKEGSSDDPLVDPNALFEGLTLLDLAMNNLKNGKKEAARILIGLGVEGNTTWRDHPFVKKVLSELNTIETITPAVSASPSPASTPPRPLGKGRSVISAGRLPNAPISSSDSVRRACFPDTDNNFSDAEAMVKGPPRKRSWCKWLALGALFLLGAALIATGVLAHFGVGTWMTALHIASGATLKTKAANIAVGAGATLMLGSVTIAGSSSCTFSRPRRDMEKDTDPRDQDAKDTVYPQLVPGLP